MEAETDAETETGEEEADERGLVVVVEALGAESVQMEACLAVVVMHGRGDDRLVVRRELGYREAEALAASTRMEHRVARRDERRLAILVHARRQRGAGRHVQR